MSPTLPCRYFALGHCAKGSDCPYLHSSEKASQICQFYLKGNCSFGQRCALKHSKPKASPSFSNSSLRTTATTKTTATKTTTKTTTIPFSQVRVGNKLSDASSLLCKFSKQDCKFKDKCRLVHGLQCPLCLEYCLHPNDSPETHQKHQEECAKSMEEEERSREMECVVCFEQVRQGGRGTFGLLACTHCVWYTLY